MRYALVAASAVLLLAGCGGSDMTIDGEPVSSPYDGPLSQPISDVDDADVMERSGAAGRALECDGAPYNGGSVEYHTGLASAQDSATDALRNAFDEEDLGALLPDDGYRIERDDGSRVLFSYEVATRTKIAFIAADGVLDYDDDEGWGIETWAQCDPAELPASVTEALGIGVWEDSTGTRVPVTEVQSFQGAEHCDWQDITFLQFSRDDADQEYLRNPSDDLADYLRTEYQTSAELPDDAADTGLRRDGRQLWLGPGQDAAYLVSIDDPDDVEQWPASTEPIRCA